MPSIDDKEDMQFADEAYDILGFSNEEKYNVYKVCRNKWENVSVVSECSHFLFCLHIT